MRTDEEQGVLCVLDMVVVNVVYRVIYHDSDVVMVDDIVKLWETNLTSMRVIEAPEYYHANFTKYFTEPFWSDLILSSVWSWIW